MRVTRVLHASVNTNRDLEASVSFYRQVLGLCETDRPDIPGVPGVWFAVGGVELHLVGSAPLGVALDPGAHHVCFAVDDLDAAVAELEAFSIAFVTGEQHQAHGVVRQVWVTDPVGNVVELQQDSEATPAPGSDEPIRR